MGQKRKVFSPEKRKTWKGCVKTNAENFEQLSLLTRRLPLCWKDIYDNCSQMQGSFYFLSFLFLNLFFVYLSCCLFCLLLMYKYESLTFSRSTITTIFSNVFLYLARSLPLFTSFALYHQNHGSLWLKLASYYQDVSFVEVYVKQTLQKEKWAEQVLLFIFTQFFFGFSYMYINIYTEYIEYTVYIQYRRIIYTKQDWFCQSRNNFCRNYKTGSAGVAAAK